MHLRDAAARFGTAVHVERHLAYRTRVAAQVARLAALLDAWDEWDADQLLPPAERRIVKAPEGGREAVSVLHHALLSELHDLDGPPAPEEGER
jgi:hypothetical protein